MNTKPAVLSSEDIQKLSEHLSRRGASIVMQDSRMTSVINWLLITTAMTLVAVGAWGIQSINRLNESMAVVIQQNTYAQRINEAQDRRLDIYDERLRLIEMGAK